MTGLFLFLFRNASTVRSIAVASSVVNFLLTLPMVFSASASNYATGWINFMGIQFSLGDLKTDVTPSAKLPAAGNATPSTYMVDGKQYIVIACGGGKNGAPSGGTYVAFALP